MIKSYIENTNPISGFANKVIGSLPVIGLIARIVNDEGGLAGDIIDFAEFRRRVGNKCSISDSRAFIEFQDRRGKVLLLVCDFLLLLFQCTCENCCLMWVGRGSIVCTIVLLVSCSWCWSS